MLLKSIIKFILAGITAFLFLNILCLAYFNVPVRIATKTGTTDFYWEPHSYYSKMTEGFGYGKMNNEGFNNTLDYSGQQIDILLFGSSNMEGMNVPQNLTTAAVLNKLFNNTKYVYNIGAGGHILPQFVNNLETAIRYYKPDKYIIIEIPLLEFDLKSMEDAINDTLERIPSNTGILVYLLQKMPYLRLIYSQYRPFLERNNNDNNNINDDDESQQSINALPDTENYSDILDAAIRKMRRLSVDNGIKIIIFYNPPLTLKKDGSEFESIKNDYLKIYEDVCYNNNVTFINMYEVFSDEYKNNYKLPYGFFNTHVGAGHLNRNGHRLIANKLFRQILNPETDDTI